MMNNETRSTEGNIQGVESRGEGDNKTNVVIGYASVFNSLSQNLGGFYEIIDPKAFDNVLDDDVRAVFNHDPNMVLGRSTAGTLRMLVDGTGLKYEIDMPENELGRSLAVSIERGDISGSSFKFQILEDSWELDSEGREVRTVLNVGRLLDVGPVTFPAYLDATAAKRSLDEIQTGRTNVEVCNNEINTLSLNLLGKSLNK